MNVILEVIKVGVLYVVDQEFQMLIIVKSVHKWKKIETDVQRLLI